MTDEFISPQGISLPELHGYFRPRAGLGHGGGPAALAVALNDRRGTRLGARITARNRVFGRP